MSSRAGGNGGITGLYEGAFTFKSNEAALLEAEKISLKEGNARITPESIEAALQGKQEQIRKFDSYFQSLASEGKAILHLTIFNTGTPPKLSAFIRDDKDVFTGLVFKTFDLNDPEYLPDSKLEITDRGFTSVISTKAWPYNHITTQTFTGQITGDEMTGSWRISKDGAEIYAGEFRLRKAMGN
ncbi:MAG: hypothetical protein IPP73_01030 [Chitinophagaceae bacterium]|nr:hypothetical protein [Chitinophagaceae bacterium]